MGLVSRTTLAIVIPTLVAWIGNPKLCDPSACRRSHWNSYSQGVIHVHAGTHPGLLMLAPPKAFAILSRGTGHRNSTARHTNPKLIHQPTLFHCLRDRFLGHRLDLLQNCVGSHFDTPSCRFPGVLDILPASRHVATNFLLHLLPHFTEKWRNYHPWGFDCVTCSTEGFRHGRKNSGAGRLLKQGDL